MRITLRWLAQQGACKEGRDWWRKRKIADGLETVRALIEDNKLSWANWLIVRIFNHEQQIRYAVFAAEQVLHIYEEQHPGDERPRKAIDAAKTYLASTNKAAATAAATAAAWAAVGAAGVAADAAFAATAAAGVAWVAADAATAAAAAAWAAVGAEMKVEVLEYGIRLLVASEGRN